jgi:hypothetical protein
MAEEDPKADRKAKRKELEKKFRAGYYQWQRNGGQGVYAPWGLLLGKFKRTGGGNEDDNDDGGSDDNAPPPVKPEPTRPKSNSWPDIVANYFPKGAGTQYKDGGLVRGGGKAVKGRGRGKFV